MNKVVHFEVPADDVSRAQGFYRDVFGWEMNPIADMGYTIVMTGPTEMQSGPKEPGFINGGMMKREGVVTGPVVTIEVADIDEALKNVAAHGGSVAMAKQTVGDMGFSAYFRDSEGNLMGLWQPVKK